MKEMMVYGYGESSKADWFHWSTEEYEIISDLETFKDLYKKYPVIACKIEISALYVHCLDYLLMTGPNPIIYLPNNTEFELKVLERKPYKKV